MRPNAQSSRSIPLCHRRGLGSRHPSNDWGRAMPKKRPKTFADPVERERLREIRKARGLSRLALAKAINVRPGRHLADATRTGDPLLLGHATSRLPSSRPQVAQYRGVRNLRSPRPSLLFLSIYSMYRFRHSLRGHREVAGQSPNESSGFWLSRLHLHSIPAAILDAERWNLVGAQVSIDQLFVCHQPRVCTTGSMVTPNGHWPEIQISELHDGRFFVL
jgi:transcriptional regulator with XRE-family HTH domain